jgi:hypothetical protein
VSCQRVATVTRHVWLAIESAWRRKAQGWGAERKPLVLFGVTREAQLTRFIRNFSWSCIRSCIGSGLELQPSLDNKSWRGICAQGGSARSNFRTAKAVRNRYAAVEVRIDEMASPTFQPDQYCYYCDDLRKAYW